MPITKRQFELGIDSAIQEWMEKLYDLLKEHEDQAYSFSDLAGEFHVSSVPPDQRVLAYRAFQEALNVLTKIGACSVREVRGTNYYAFNFPFKKGNWERDMSGIPV